MSRRAFLAVVVATVFVAVPAAASASTRIGTPSSGIINRQSLDTRQNFSVWDTQQVAQGPGVTKAIEFYAGATGAIQFFLTDSSNTVKDVSGPIVVSQTGVQTYVLAAPWAVATGDRLGYYTAAAGVIPFDSGTSSVDFTVENSGPPVMGAQLGIDGSRPRVYSFGATVTPFVNTKDQCKQGGFENVVAADGSSFKNQGDCVSYVATGGNH
jgi:hypothetical protein